MAATTIHLVRHGEVENPKGIIYGRLPGYHLSERGRREAAAAAERLADADIGAVHSSPLERARETAEMIATPHGLAVVADPRLTESDSTLEGVGRTLWAIVGNPRHWWRLRNPMRPTWGESFAEIRARMVGGIDHAVEEAGGREVVIVTHQTPLLVARLALTRRRLPPWIGFAPCQTGSVTSLEIEDEKPVSASYFAPPV